MFVSDISLEQASALMTKCVNEVSMAWVKLIRITGVLNEKFERKMEYFLIYRSVLTYVLGAH